SIQLIINILIHSLPSTPRDRHANEFPDQECQECTTAGRTPAEVLTSEYVNLWPEHEDEDNAEWLPNDYSQSDSKSPEDGSEAEFNDQYGCRDEFEHNLPHVLEYIPPQPERQPHGTWRDRLIFYRGQDCRQSRETIHSQYCLDVHAKMLHRQHRQIDLDGLLHRRKNRSCPETYGLGHLSLRRRPV
ncbi:unnamed protein product, partial [Clonostachys rosea]